MTLSDLATKYGCDKGPLLGHDYTRIYEQHFELLRYSNLNVLEIGVAEGRSIAMWLDYFPNAQIYGLDIGGRIPPPYPRYHHIAGDAREASIWATLPQFWCVIDDGGHWADQVRIAFMHGWRHVLPGGLWIVEDLHCAYSPDYNRPGEPTIMDWAVAGIHQMNDLGRDMCGNPKHDRGDFAFMHFYKSLVIIGKKA